MSKEDHTGRNIAIGAAVAAAVGYVAGILTAPKSGKDTRADITDKASSVRDAMLQEMSDRQQELLELLERAKNETVALSGKARTEFNEAVDLAKDAQGKLRIAILAVKSGEADDPELNKAIKQAKAAAKNLNKYFKS